MTTALKNKKLLIGVLCAVLFLALVAGAAIYLFSPYHYLSIDVNPSIEVQANRLGKVTGVSAVNDDAEPILQDLNLTGMDATAATQVIIARLADEGYLNETDHNQILLTVRDSRNSRSFLADIKNSVSAALSARNLTASLAGQSLDFDDERSAAAHSYHMSVGKYTIAEKIHNAYDDIPLAALSDAKISELLAYAEAHNIDFDDLLDFYEESFDDNEYCEHCGKPESECRDACERAWELYCDDCGRLNAECRDTCDADGDYCEHCGKTERECRDACDRAWELYCDDCGRPVAECDGYCDDDRRPASSAPVKAESSPSSVPSAGSSSSAASSRPVRGDDDYCEHCGKPEWECRDACDRAWELYCDDCGRLNAECRDTCDADGDYCEHCGKTERECRDACERAWELYCDDCGRLKTECRDTCDD